MERFDGCQCGPTQTPRNSLSNVSSSSILKDGAPSTDGSFKSLGSLRRIPKPNALLTGS